MSDLVARLRSVFLAPSASAARPRASQRSLARRLGGSSVRPRASERAASRRLLASAAPLAVVGPAGSAAPVAAGLALALARDAGAACALVAGLGVPPASRAPGRRAANRAAAALAARELPATASGRLVLLSLDPPARPRDFGRAAAAVDGPAVLLVAGPRTAEADALLATQDAIVLALPRDSDPVLAEVAEDSLAALGPPVLRTGSPLSAITARLALTGLAAPASLRSALAPALELAR